MHSRVDLLAQKFCRLPADGRRHQAIWQKLLWPNCPVWSRSNWLACLNCPFQPLIRLVQSGLLALSMLRLVPRLARIDREITSMRVYPADLATLVYLCLAALAAVEGKILEAILYLVLALCHRKRTCCQPGCTGSKVDTTRTLP